MTCQTRHIEDIRDLEPRGAGLAMRPPQSGPRMHANERSETRGHRSPDRRAANRTSAEGSQATGRPAWSHGDSGLLAHLGESSARNAIRRNDGESPRINWDLRSAVPDYKAWNRPEP